MKIIYKQCPRCDSRDTLKIIYGMPKEGLRETEDYWLGGCCIEVDDEGKSVSPQYHCKICGYEWNKKKAVKDWYSKVESIRFIVTGYFTSAEEVYLNIKDGWIEKKRYITNLPNKDLCNSCERKVLSEIELKSLVDNLIACDFLAWKRKYVDLNILDGEQWEIEYVIRGKKKIITGDNDYPEGWDKFIQVLEAF